MLCVLCVIIVSISSKVIILIIKEDRAEHQSDGKVISSDKDKLTLQGCMKYDKFTDIDCRTFSSINELHVSYYNAFLSFNS